MIPQTVRLVRGVVVEDPDVPGRRVRLMLKRGVRWDGRVVEHPDQGMIGRAEPLLESTLRSRWVTVNPDDVDHAASLAARLGVDARWARVLCRHGVRSIEDMAGWTVGDLAGVPGAGIRGLRALVPALRAAGVPLPWTGGPLWVPEELTRVPSGARGERTEEETCTA